MARWCRLLLVGHAALALAFVATGNWILVLLVTFAPYLATWFKIVTTCRSTSAWSRTWPTGGAARAPIWPPVVRFFYWNMNYHVEHHMFAAVPFYNLPKLRAVLGAELPVAPRGLLATWLEILDTLRKQKRDPGYLRPLQYPAAN